MPVKSSEIIEDMTDHIKRFGGDFSAWCVGTAQDAHNPLFDADRLKDSDDALIYREAYTLASARAVRDHFVSDCGMTQINGDAEDPAHGSRAGSAAAASADEDNFPGAMPSSHFLLGA